MAKAASIAPREVELVDRYQKLSAKNKALFREMNDAEEQLLRLVDAAPENTIVLPDLRRVGRKDNFAGGNTFFKIGATKRFEITIT